MTTATDLDSMLFIWKNLPGGGVLYGILAAHMFVQFSSCRFRSINKPH